MRVVVADDSVLLRKSIVRILDDSGFEVVGQAGDAEDLVRKVAAHKPDVAIVDVRMPPTNTDDGLRAAQKIRAEYPTCGVLVLSQYIEEGYALELLSENAEGVGYLLKDRVADVEQQRQGAGVRDQRPLQRLERRVHAQAGEHARIPDRLPDGLSPARR